MKLPPDGTPGRRRNRLGVTEAKVNVGLAVLGVRIVIDGDALEARNLALTLGERDLLARMLGLPSFVKQRDNKRR